MHLEQFLSVPAEWQNDALSQKWATIRDVRRVITGALEIERREKRIGASLEASPTIYIADKDLFDTFSSLDVAKLSITSTASLEHGAAPSDAFTLDDVEGVGVVSNKATGGKCERCWHVLEEVNDAQPICQRCQSVVN